MRSRWLTALIVPLGLGLGLGLGGCDAERQADEPRPAIPDAPGSITPDIDRQPEPRLRADTLQGMETDTAPDAQPQ